MYPCPLYTENIASAELFRSCIYIGFFGHFIMVSDVACGLFLARPCLPAGWARTKKWKIFGELAGWDFRLKVIFVLSIDEVHN